MKNSRVIWIVLCLAMMAGIIAGDALQAAGPVSLSIEPTSARVKANETQVFTAVISGTTDNAIVWTITEGSKGGKIVNQGNGRALYTAPSIAGTFHITAISKVNPSAKATATVYVEAPAGVFKQYKGTITMKRSLTSPEQTINEMIEVSSVTLSYVNGDATRGLWKNPSGVMVVTSINNKNQSQTITSPRTGAAKQIAVSLLLHKDTNTYFLSVGSADGIRVKIVSGTTTTAGVQTIMGTKAEGIALPANQASLAGKTVIAEANGAQVELSWNLRGTP